MLTLEITDILERLNKRLEKAEQAADFIIITKQFVTELETGERDEKVDTGLSDDLYSWAWETLVWKLKKIPTKLRKWLNY